MAKLIHFQSDFTAGEISPKLLARVDLKAYDNALKTMENAYAMTHGGAKRRPGTVFVGELKNSGQRARLIPFIYSKTVSFVLVINGGVIQFIKNGAYVMNGSVRYEVACPYSETELADLTFAQAGNTLYLAHTNYAPRILRRTTDTNWTLSPIAFTYKALTDQWYQNDYIKFKIIGGVDAFSVGDTFTFSINGSGVIDYRPKAKNDVGFTVAKDTTLNSFVGGNDIQSADGGNTWAIGTAPAHGTVTITAATGAFSYTPTAGYTGTDSFTYTLTDADGDSSTATVSLTVVSGTVSSSTNTNKNTGSLYGVAVTNTLVAQTWTITCVVATGSRQEWVVSGSVSGTPTLTWNTGKYPATVGFFEQRLYFGGTSAEPQTIWGSVVSDYTNFTLGPNDGDAVSFTFASNRYDQIIHLESARQLIAMSSGGEFSLTGGTAGITPSSVRIRANTFHGSAPAKPIRISQEVIFLQRDRRKVRAISYSVAEDTNLATDLTLFAEHITGTGIVDMTFTQDPDYLLWAARDDGVLLSMTHLRDQQITGWARHITDGAFENCTAVPESNSDQTYLVVNRTVNGVTKRYVEQLDYSTGAMTDAAVFGYSATKTATWSGITHLEGKTVSVVADGIPHGNRVVTDGTVTLDYPVNNVQIGLPYITTLEMLHPAESLADGSSQARAVSIPKVTLRFSSTSSCKLNDANVPFRTNMVPIGQPTPLFTGDKVVTMLGWRSPMTLKIVQDLPSPLTILGVALQVSIPDLND